MAIDIKFDLIGNPEPPTIVLATRSGNKLGQLDVNAESINLSDKLNDASEFSFTLNKYYFDEKEEIEKITNLWNKVVDFKLVYCKEWDMWFEITVELDEETETVKTVFCTQLGQAELSQIKLYDMHINEDGDTNWDKNSTEYKKTILYDEKDKSISLLDRLLKDKAPHYFIVHVDDTIKKIQRTFSFDDISILDAFMDIAEEIGCLFVFHSDSDENGNIRRGISVYDLQQNCLKCGHRGEFTNECPECENTDIKYGYGEDTLIFVTADELASGGIQLTTDTDEVKNCFKLEAGDDLMTATVRNCNPNGTDYIWRFSDDMKSDMSEELVGKLEEYDIKYKDCCDNHESKVDSDMVNKYNMLVEKYNSRYCLDCGYSGYFKNSCPECKSTNIQLQLIPDTIIGYSPLMNAYYNAIDLSLYLQSGLMPDVKMGETNAEEQGLLLETSLPSLIAVTDLNTVSLSTSNSTVLAMARAIVNSAYKVEIKSESSELVDNNWSGIFVVTNYSDEKDTYTTITVSRELTDWDEEYIKQQIEKVLSKENTDNLSVTGLFEKELSVTTTNNLYSFSGEFYDELKKYALNPLMSFHKACQACINILIAQGVADKESWAEKTEGAESNLYEKLYIPYYNKLLAIESEVGIRESEVNLINGIYKEETDSNGNKISVLDIGGLKQEIERCRNEIQNILNFQEYLGEELWLEFCAYRREDKYSNDNYISDGLNNAKLFERAFEFFKTAEDEIYKSSELQHSISTTLKNLLAIPKFKLLVKSFKVGNWIRVQIDDDIYKLRLLEYEIDYSDFDNIPVEFSDVIKLKNGITDVKDILSQASSMATSYSSTQKQASQGDKAKETIEDWILNGLNSALVQIQNNDSEEVTLTKEGLLGRSYSDITGDYSPEQIKITHNIMAYTDDNWNSVRLAMGKHDYMYYEKDANGFVSKVNKTGYGLNADFVTAGIVSGSQIIGGDIYSDNYSVIEGTGSYLNLRDGTFSFGGGALRFENGKILINSPDIPTTDTITEINEEYLKTTSVYAQNLQVNSAKINGQLTAKQINTEGLIAENISGTTLEGKYISGGSITGSTITGGSFTSMNEFNNGVTIENGNSSYYFAKMLVGSIYTGDAVFSVGALAGFNMAIYTAKHLLLGIDDNWLSIINNLTTPSILIGEDSKDIYINGKDIQISGNVYINGTDLDTYIKNLLLENA